MRPGNRARVDPPPARAMLSADEIARYRRDGHLVPDYTVPDALLAAMRGAFDRLLAANPGHASDSMVCPHLAHDGAQHLLETPLRGSDEWMDFARAPEILDMAAQLNGPDLILWGTTLFGKPARVGKETPWHQDSTYWPIDPPAACSVWIALDDATPENGCLRVAPGSHRARQTFGHRERTGGGTVLALEVDDDAFDPSAVRDVPLRAGQVSFHDIHLLHGSNANRSGRRRAGFVLRLMPATSRFDHALGAAWARQGRLRLDFGRRRLVPVCGVDRAGNDFSIGADDAPAPGPAP